MNSEKNLSYNFWNAAGCGVEGRYSLRRPARITRRTAEGVEVDEMPAGHELVLRTWDFHNAGFRGIEINVSLPDGWKLIGSAGMLEAV